MKRGEEEKSVKREKNGIMRKEIKKKLEMKLKTKEEGS